MEKKKYALLEDIIEISGTEAIKRLTRGGNEVYLDIVNLEKKAKAEEAKGSFGPYSLMFEYLSNFDVDNNKIYLKNGGTLHLTIPKEDSDLTYLTKSKISLFNLKRKSKKVEEPSFLYYGPEIFDKGIVEIEPEIVKKLNENKTKIYSNELKLSELMDLTGDEYFNNQIIKIRNSYFKVKNELEYLKSEEFETGRYFITDIKDSKLVRIFPDDYESILKGQGFKPRNLEQKIAFSQLTDKNIELNFIVGGSGSGKTVIAYTTAIETILKSVFKEEKKGRTTLPNKIILFKSNDIIGGKRREMGFLPGTAFEKMKPFLKSYIDAHKLIGLDNYIPFEELLAHPKFEKDEFGLRDKNARIGKYFLPKDDRAIEIEYLQFARGRTFENCIVFVDEAQNYTPYEIKTLIERVGIGSKIILVGDPNQVDNPKLTPTFNGLTYAAHINYMIHPRMSINKLNQNYRSQSAEIMRQFRAPGEDL
jgi:predicted ribonuclease YlaK